MGSGPQGSEGPKCPGGPRGDPEAPETTESPVAQGTRYPIPIGKNKIYFFSQGPISWDWLGPFPHKKSRAFFNVHSHVPHTEFST